MQCRQNGGELLKLDSRQVGEVEPAAIAKAELEQQLRAKIADVLGGRVEPSIDSGPAGSGWPHTSTDRAPVPRLVAERLDEVLFLEVGQRAIDDGSADGPYLSKIAAWRQLLGDGEAMRRLFGDEGKDRPLGE
jgi:hypothetical protein